MFQSMNYDIARSTHEHDLRRARVRHQLLLHEEHSPRPSRGRPTGDA